MDKNLRFRVLEEADHIINTNDTIRKTAQKFNVSKSTVHQDLSSRLKELDENLYGEINKIFKDHDESKHLRGGEVTKQKYKRG